MINISHNSQRVFNAGNWLIEEGGLHRVSETLLTTCPEEGLHTQQRVARAFERDIPLVEVELLKLGPDMPKHLGQMTISGVRLVQVGILESRGYGGPRVAHRVAIEFPITPDRHNLVAATLHTDRYSAGRPSEGVHLEAGWIDHESGGSFSPHAQQAFDSVVANPLPFASFAASQEAKQQVPTS